MTTEWRFTSDGEPAYYADTDTNREWDLAGTEMPGYRPGTVRGSIQERDLWDLLIATKFWLVAINAQHEDIPEDAWEDYIWAVDAKTDFLYGDPDRDGTDEYYLDDQRVVTGAFHVVDELNHMGFSACFSHDVLQALVLETDTQWQVIVTSHDAYDDPEPRWKVHTWDTV